MTVVADRPQFTTTAGNQNSISAGPPGQCGVRDAYGLALKFHTEEGNWNLTGKDSRKSP
jgi:catalase